LGRGRVSTGAGVELEDEAIVWQRWRPQSPRRTRSASWSPGLPRCPRSADWLDARLLDEGARVTGTANLIGMNVLRASRRH